MMRNLAWVWWLLVVLCPLACRGQSTPRGEMYGKYRLFDTRYDEAKKDKAKENAADVITQLKNEANVCLIGLWAYNPPNILQAVKEAGLEGRIRIVAFDEDKDTLQGIRDGHIHATVVQQPYLFGFESVKTLAEKGKKKIAIVTNNADPFWNIVEAGARQAAKGRDIVFEYRRPVTGTVDEQETIINDLATRQFDGVAVSVINPDQQKDFLNKMAEKMMVICQDNDAPESKREMYIGTDNYAAGREAGRLVKEALPDGGVIAIFVGRPDSLNAVQRRQGLLDELAGKDDSARHRAAGAVHVPHRVIRKENVDEFQKELEMLMRGG